MVGLADVYVVCWRVLVLDGTRVAFRSPSVEPECGRECRRRSLVNARAVADEDVVGIPFRELPWRLHDGWVNAERAALVPE
jgi:hypothetical protein